MARLGPGTGYAIAGRHSTPFRRGYRWEQGVGHGHVAPGRHPDAPSAVGHRFAVVPEIAGGRGDHGPDEAHDLDQGGCHTPRLLRHGYPDSASDDGTQEPRGLHTDPEPSGDPSPPHHIRHRRRGPDVDGPQAEAKLERRDATMGAPQRMPAGLGMRIAPARRLPQDQLPLADRDTTLSTMGEMENRYARHLALVGPIQGEVHQRAPVAPRLQPPPNPHQRQGSA